MQTHGLKTLLIAGLLAAAAQGASAASAATAREVYRAGPQTCGGYPRAAIDMAPGFCAGLVVAPSTAGMKARRMKMPRALLDLGNGRDWLVSDLGGWTPAVGAVWRLHAEPGRPATVTPVLSGLSMPHTLAFGPDGRVYVGEMNRISVFDPKAADPKATLTPVVIALPDNRLHANRHPLSSFLFEPDGALLVNVGAPTDQCADAKGQPDGDRVCAESEGDEPMAGLRRYAYLGAGRWSDRYTIVARGLRNSMALARHGSGTLLQAENGMDFASAEEPYEAINEIVTGRHYGWPYCYDMDRFAPVWAARKAMDCASTARARPLALMPPHAAPLAMLYYHGAMFPSLEGDLLMSWHGYRATGSRIVAFPVDAKGRPHPSDTARYPLDDKGKLAWKPYLGGPGVEPRLITRNWRQVAGLRPTGSPVGLAVAPDGAIWVAEDHNGTILRIAADKP